MDLGANETILTDWTTHNFTFVASFWKTTLTNKNTDSYVATYDIVKDPNGRFQGFDAIEPNKALFNYVKFELRRVQFHYPAEHVWAVLHNETEGGANQTERADLEMQVYAYDMNHMGSTCGSGYAALSFFFFLDDTGKGSDETNNFFNFTESGMDFDLSFLFDLTTPMHYGLYGYLGGFTQPPCQVDLCWYMLQRRFPITQK